MRFVFGRAALAISLLVSAAVLAPDRAAARSPAPAVQGQTPGPFIEIDGGHNFRDLGGYRTADGRMVRRGVFYRSASMANLTPQGMVQSARTADRFDHRLALDPGAPPGHQQLACHVRPGLLGA